MTLLSISDFTFVSKSLSNYLWMLSLIILCVSLSLSLLTLLVLQVILIRPILDFHSVLTIKCLDTDSTADELLDYDRKDELGDIYRAFRKVWEKIKLILLELQAQQLNLEQANQKMENAIHEKTKNLVHTNIKLQKEIDQHERSRQRIQELTKFPEQNDSPIMRIRNDGRMLYANGGSKELLRLWNIKSDMQIPEKWANVVRDVSEIGKTQKYEIQIGDEVFLADFVPVADTNYVNMYSTNITQHKKIEAELNHVTNHDNITNLPNKHIFENRLSKLLTESKRDEELSFVSCLEIKDLEEISLISGHDYRDDVFQSIAKRIVQHSNLTSVATRIQAGRFLLGSGGYKNINEIREFLENLMNILRAPIPVDSQSIHANFQMGISVCPDDSDNARTLCRNAEMALYRATSKDANHIEFYHEKINSDLERHQKLTRCMEDGLKTKNEFKLVFQPQVDLKTMKITGSEVLVRWDHPELGRISPAEFIPIAEKSDLILKVGDWVLREACKAYHTFKSRGVNDLKFSVNLSMRQLMQRGVVSHISKILTEENTPPEMIEFEVTESFALEKPEVVIGVLNGLSDAGFEIALDDFGTGYSSLSYLRMMPVDRLKIDRCFVNDMVHNKQDLQIVKMILDLAKTLEMKVVAEGAEKQDQVDLLRHIGCDVLQGFYVSPPVDLNNFINLYNSYGKKEIKAS